MLFLSQAIGVVGVILTLVAYYLLQTGKISAEKPLYSWLNGVGAVMIVFSLFWEWNLPSFLMEGAWALISFGKVIYLWRKPRMEAPHG